MVKFGRYLLEAAEQSNIPASAFVDYKQLKKKAIKPIIETKKNEGAGRIEQTYIFQQQLDEQLTKLHDFIQNKVAQLQSDVMSLRKQFEQEAADKSLHTGEFRAAADRLSEEYVRLSSFVAINRLAVDKIVKKHDKHAPLAFRELFPFFIEKRASLLPTSFFDTHVLALSDFYAELRGESVDKNVAVGTNFERQSIKYWVHPQDAMTVIMIIIRHLPVYSFKPAEPTAGEYHRKCISNIKSVYYDNEQLFMYHTRIRREEGASLIRIRWYDNKDDKVFVERKIHHESWVQETSTKERFVLPGMYMDAFLMGTYKTEDFLNYLASSGKVKDQESIVHQKELFDEVYQRLVTYDLFPSIRTHYNRMAFQIPGDASVRISLDLDVELSTEWLCPPGHWRTERTDGETVYQFPYSIMEVKLAGAEIPTWVKDLMASKFVEAVPKFSKFGHATATLHNDRVTLLPYWYHQMDKEIESIYKPQHSTLFREFRPRAYPSSTPHTQARQGLEAFSGPLRNITSRDMLSVASDHGDENRSSEDDFLGTPTKSPMSEEGGGSFSHSPGGARGRRRRSTTASTAIAISGAVRGRLPWWQRDEGGTQLEKGKTPAQQQHQQQVVTVKAKVEPKTYLANERTFLHWISISSLVAMMALGILRKHANGAESSAVVRVVGGSAFVVAVLYMAYALGVYVQRCNQISERKVQNFTDIRGPVVLTLLLVATVSISCLAQLGLLSWVVSPSAHQEM